MSTNELIEKTANGIEDDILGIPGIDGVPSDLTVMLKSRLYDFAREFVSGAKREITSGLEDLVNRAIG